MLISVVFASGLLLTSSAPATVHETGKWGLVRKLEGKAPPAMETFYGTKLSASISEGHLSYTDTPAKPNVFTSADITMSWTSPKSELTPGETLEFKVTAEAKVSQKDANILNLTGWYRFDGFKIVEQKNAFVGHAANGFVGNGEGVAKVIVPAGADNTDIHIWQGQTGLSFGSGGIWYPCQYWYKWNAKPIDNKEPAKPPETKPVDPTKKKLNVLIAAVDYRELYEKVSPDGGPPYSALSDGGHTLHGVAADGSSLVLLRTAMDVSGQATFRAPTAGGGLSAVTDSNLYRSKGNPTLTVNTIPIGGLHYAFALYRPPNTFGADSAERDLEFTVDFKVDSDKYEDPKAKIPLKLVRPPVVLVHGTYDSPKACYQEVDPLDDSPMSLATRLRNAGFNIFCVDWEESNGAKDPSSFVYNSKAVWRNKDGIQTALESMRRMNIAVTQADLVCHSQGGVIARVYARGFDLMDPIPASHLTNPVECKSSGVACWYHRKDNHWSGDIHRLITISATHRGSEVCRLFEAFKQYKADWSPLRDVNRFLVGAFLVYVDKEVSGITTDGFKNQTPGSLELQAVGPTPIPAHAIGCVASNEIMATVRPDEGGITGGMGNYFGKLYKIWKLTPDDAKQFAFDYLGDKAAEKGDPKPRENAEAYRRLLLQFQVEEGQLYGDAFDAMKFRKAISPVIFQMRKTVFLDDENDCTVSFTSSSGGLKGSFITKAEGVLHGWAPRYRVVQNRVLELLRNDGSLFDPNGFPDFDGKQSSASQFLGRAALAPTTYLISQSSGEAALKPGVKSPNFVGATFTTVEGDWAFTSNGTKVSATHRTEVLSLEGTLAGHTLKFTLATRTSKTQGEITFAADWTSFDGYYRNPGGQKWEFKGTRKGASIREFFGLD